MKKKSLNSLELLDYQPNRYPFLMIDFVTEVVPGKLAHGYKNFTNNAWFFPIHFPGHPNVPGALQLEALAQMLTVAITTLPGNKGKVTHAISHKFKRNTTWRKARNRNKSFVWKGASVKVLVKELSLEKLLVKQK